MAATSPKVLLGVDRSYLGSTGLNPPYARILQNLDRRWIFLAMLLVVAVPILAQGSFPEKPTKLVQDAFAYVEDLPEGSNVLFSLDYEPSSEGELSPMTTALVRHCCLKRHKMFFMTLWPGGLPLLDRNIRQIIEKEFADLELKDGEDYVNLGFNAGKEVVIIVMGTNLRKMFPNDIDGTLDIPMTANISNLRHAAHRQYCWKPGNEGVGATPPVRSTSNSSSLNCCSLQAYLITPARCWTAAPQGLLNTRRLGNKYPDTATKYNEAFAVGSAVWAC